MLRKVCPCSGCGKPLMCVSHDNFRFYCNRCLPYYVRRTWEWINENEQPKPEQAETIPEQIPPDTPKSNSKVSKPKKTK